METPTKGVEMKLYLVLSAHGYKVVDEQCNELLRTGLRREAVAFLAALKS